MNLIESVAVRFRINGTNYGLRLDPRTSLLNLLREKLDLPGTKKGCDHGQCGACTVIIDGRRINSCLTLAVIYDGSEITTVEGLAKGDDEIRERMSGNICRCGAYPGIVAAIREVTQQTSQRGV